MMKKTAFLLISVILLACSAKNSPFPELSKAKISNLQIHDLGNHERGYYKLGIEFDYAIENFHPVVNLYRCTVQIMFSDSKSSISAWIGKNCEITQAVGHETILVSAPRDKGLRSITPDRYQPERFADPPQYMVLILQNLNPTRSKSIATQKFQAPGRIPVTP